MVQGMFGMGGPFFLLYYDSVEGRADKIRDTTIAVFFVSNLLRLPVATATAQFTPAVLTAALYTLPVFAAAMYFGSKLTERLSTPVFRYVAMVILFIAAAQLMLV